MINIEIFENVSALLFKGVRGIWNDWIKDISNGFMVIIKPAE